MSEPLKLPDCGTAMCDRKKLRTFIHLVLMVFALGLVSSLSQRSQSPSGGLESHDVKAGLRYLPLIPVSAQATPQASPLPQLVDITGSTGIKFEHLSSPEQKYIVESMSGGVALIDYDRDGWPDIFLTNSQSVEIALAGKKARSALYHNNHDGTFTDVTEKAGVGYPCWAMGAVVGDYNNDGWPDMLITCEEGMVLYRNNGDGTFTDVTKQAGLTDPRWSTGAAFGDYDGDGFVDLMVSRYVEFDLNHLPQFGATC